MADPSSLFHNPPPLSEEEQRKAGKAIAGSMPEEHRKFVANLRSLIESGAIDVHKPESFLRRDVADGLTDGKRHQVDLALVNLADLIRHIDDFYRSKETPNESPHLESMIEQAWQMTQRIEKSCGDVFKF